MSDRISDQRLRQIWATFAALCFLLSSAVEAQAQNANNQRYDNTVGSVLGSVLGTIVQNARRAEVQRSWNAISSDTIGCFNLLYASKHITADGLISSSVSATDQRLVPTMTFCKEATTRMLKSDYPCALADDKGQNFDTMCNDTFAKIINGVTVPVERDEYIRIAASGGKVLITALETSDGKILRLRAEKAQKDLARQNYLETPEGKKEAAFEAALERQKEAEIKQKENELRSFKPY